MTPAFSINSIQNAMLSVRFPGSFAHTNIVPLPFDAVLKRADYKLSFSRMTFPHQLMQMILLEQIYRGYRIMNHEPYHK